MLWESCLASEKALISVHSQGEVEKRVSTVMASGTASTVVDTFGRRVRVEWDPTASVTPMDKWVSFSQFLATAELFSEWVKNCLLSYTSPNAPAKQDVQGTLALVYNGWSSFVRCAEPKRPREAITRRPLLLCGVGRLSESGNQLKIQLTSLHEEAKGVERGSGWADRA